MRRFAILLALLALVVAACGGTTETTEGPGTTADQGTAATEAPADDGDDAAAADDGGQVVVGLFQEPDNLNPMFAVQTASRIVRDMTLEGLLDADPDGNYVPVLVKEVPTVENGGISADGLTITYNLLEGVTWSDGDPLTSRDVQFTWEAILDPGNAVTSTAGYEKIVSVETPDDLTAVVTFSELFASALSLFSIPDAILPAHVLEGSEPVVLVRARPRGVPG